jgi:hypothetical protein
MPLPQYLELMLNKVAQELPSTGVNGEGAQEANNEEMRTELGEDEAIKEAQEGEEEELKESTEEQGRNIREMLHIYCITDISCVCPFFTEILLTGKIHNNVIPKYL